MTRTYKKPELICYERPNLGYFSSSNSNAACQADCSAAICTLIATAAGAPCDTCDCNDTCGLGIDPLIDCFPGECP